jgi:outer membrane protein OmpA-like peptidoglycan-associated protein
MPQSAHAVTVGCMAAVLTWTLSLGALAQDGTVTPATIPETPSAPDSSQSPPDSDVGTDTDEVVLAPKDPQIADLRAQIDSLNEALATAEQARSDMALECQALRDSQDASAARLSESEADLESSRLRVKELQDDLSATRTALHGSRKELDRQGSDYTTLERELVAIEKINAELREQHATLEQGHISATGRVEELQRHLTEALAERDAAQRVLLDRDDDGVPNELDLCAQSSDGVEVSATGCLQDAPIPLQGVTFRTGSREISDESSCVLDELAESLGRHTSLRLEVAGHTDNRGSVAANLALSQRRAESVRTYLIGRGLPDDSLSARGYGPHKPVADNATESGRALNRRVELRSLPAGGGAP